MQALELLTWTTVFGTVPKIVPTPSLRLNGGSSFLLRMRLLLFVARFVFADAFHGDLYRLFSGMNVSHRHRNLTLSCDFRDLPGITALCTQTRQVRVPKAVEDEWHDSR